MELKDNVVLKQVMELLEKQTAKGIKKYGTTVDPKNLDIDSWINHSCEELIDLLVYLQCLKESLKHDASKN